MLLSYLTITAQESTDVFFQYSIIEQDTRSDNHGLTWNELEITTLQAPIGGGDFYTNFIKFLLLNT